MTLTAMMWRSSKSGTAALGAIKEKVETEKSPLRKVSLCMAVVYQMRTRIRVQQEERSISRLLFLFAQKLNDKLLSSKLIECV